MRLNLSLIISIIIAVGLIAFSFTYFQTLSERTILNSELEKRTAQIGEEINQGDITYLAQLNDENIDRFTDSISNKYNLMGLAVYYNDDSIIANKYSLNLINNSLDYITQSIAADTSLGIFITSDGKSIYQYIKPINRETISNNVIVIYNDAEYIDNIINRIWMRNFIRWFMQALFVS